MCPEVSPVQVIYTQIYKRFKTVLMIRIVINFCTKVGISNFQTGNFFWLSRTKAKTPHAA